MAELRKIRIMIADDHVLIREGLKQILQQASDMELVAEADTIPEIMNVLSRSAPLDVLLLDLSFPDRNALEIIRDIRTGFPDRPKILILTVHSGVHYAGQSFTAGAHGFIQKDSAPDQLFHAIRQVHAGHLYAEDELKEQYQNLRGAGKNYERSLSRREKEVLKHLAKGKSTVEISKSLGLSPNTIKTYRSRLFDKLGIRNEADLVRYALNHDLFA